MFFHKNFTIDYAVYTDIGERAVNEDAVKAVKSGGGYCFVLCDGLGGHGMGDEASRTVTEVFGSCFEGKSNSPALLPTAFEAAQDILLAAQKEKRAESKMKTTCVALAMDGKQACWGHVGDSRAYLFQGGKVKNRTLDHSIPQMLVITGEIKESEIRHHPDRNIVLRVMGVPWEKKMYDLSKSFKLKSGQAFLLCSDGFWELIEEEEMCRLLEQTSSANEWVRAMGEYIKEHGRGTNMDNNSAIAVRIV